MQKKKRDQSSSSLSSQNRNKFMDFMSIQHFWTTFAEIDCKGVFALFWKGEKPLRGNMGIVNE